MQQAFKISDKAVQQLQLKANPSNASDRGELAEILVTILHYPNVELAQRHERANKLGNYDLIAVQADIEQQIREKKVDPLELCECCGAIVNDKEIPYCTALDEIKISLGVKLYFMTLRYQMIIFTLGFLLYSIFAVVTNWSASGLTQKAISDFCISSGSCGLANISTGAKILGGISTTDKYNSMVQSILGLVFVVLWGFIMLIKNHREKSLAYEIVQTQISASDFSLLLTNVPLVYLDKPLEEAKQEINSIFKRYQKHMGSIFSYEVVKINIVREMYNLHDMKIERKQKLANELEERQEKFRDWIRYRMDHPIFPLKDDQRDQFYEDYYKFYSEKYDQKFVNDIELKAKNIIIVTLRSSKAQEEISKANKESLFNCFGCCLNKKFPLKDVEIGKAPEPDEILWDNVGFPFRRQMGRKFMIYLFALILVSISFGISIGLAISESNDPNNYISILISLVIAMTNFGIQMIIMYLSKWENQWNKTSEQASTAFKIAVSQLVNIIGVPISIVYITDRDVLKSGGLVTDIFWIGLINVFTPIGRLIDPYNLWLKIKRSYYEDPKRRLNMSQKEFNSSMYATYEFDLGYQYSYIIRTSVFTAFFVCLQPIIALFTPIGLGLMYLVNHYKLLYRFKKPQFHSSTVNTIINFILHLSLVAFALGEYFCFNIQKQGSTDVNLVIHWITLGIAGFYLLFPFHLCYKCVKEPELPSMDYYEKKAVIHADYDRSNPFTKEQAIGEFQAYLKELKEKQKLPDQSKFMQMSMMLKNENEDHNRRASKGEFKPISTNEVGFVDNLHSYDTMLKP